MFSNLSRGSILHGVDWRGDMKWFTGSIERITPSMTINKPYNNSFGQYPSLAFDILVNVNGEQKQFQQIPGNDTIADFGKGAFILADNKDSLYNYIKSLLKSSEDVVSSVEVHKALIPQYKSVLSELNPGTSNASEVKELKDQVGSLQAQLAEALSLLKGEKLKEVKEK
jgi:hypothetical protein